MEQLAKSLSSLLSILMPLAVMVGTGYFSFKSKGKEITSAPYEALLKRVDALEEKSDKQARQIDKLRMERSFDRTYIVRILSMWPPNVTKPAAPAWHEDFSTSDLEDYDV